MKILKAEIIGNSNHEYRAVLVNEDRTRPEIRIEQLLPDGHWRQAGNWYLCSLLSDEFGPPVDDSISLDFGQNWNITSGMRAAITEACAIFLDNVWRNKP